jgi:hypothetical protein
MIDPKGYEIYEEIFTSASDDAEAANKMEEYFL